MNLIKIESKKKQKLSKIIFDETGLGFNQIQKIIRNKDVKVLGKRVAEDVDIDEGCLIELYLPDKKIKVIYEDGNIIAVFKSRNIEVQNFGKDDLISVLSKQISQQLYAVHRLDRNTEGLVIFAKNENAKKSLDKAFKERTIEKFYLALVSGLPENESYNLEAYLRKDEKNSLVQVSNKKQDGFEQIKTNFYVVKRFDETSLLEVELVTGKTHQIRAHLAYVGFPIIGDEKYGDSTINKKFKKKYQMLCSYKIIFHFNKNDCLAYLDNAKIELDKNEIDFCKNL